MKNPTLATVLNIIPGLGYVYLDGERKLFGTALLIGIALMIASSLDPVLYTEAEQIAPFRIWDIFANLSLVMIIGAFMYDGYMSALAQNAAVAAMEKAAK